MPYFSIASRSIPIPNANPCQTSGSTPAAPSTFGCTIPAPEDIQPVVPLADLELPPAHEQRMSTSADGSVNGKCDARNFSSTRFHLEERPAELLQHPLQVRHRHVAVDASPSTWWNIGVCVWS